MNDLNFAAALYQLGQGTLADSPALIHADQVISYGELARRASGIAAYFASLGLPQGAHIGHYMRNSNAYLEMFTGAGLAGMFHVNVNYRYRDQELIDLCNGLDIRVLVYDKEFAPIVGAIRGRLEHTVAYVEVGEGPVSDFAVDLRELYAWPAEDFTPVARGEDHVLVATGGTTGLPKGVMWRHQDLWDKMAVSSRYRMEALENANRSPTLAEHVSNVETLGPGAPFLALSPLMHGAGLLMALLMIAQGMPIVTLAGERFDPDDALDVIKMHKVGSLVLVGDAFAQPLLEALDRRESENALASLDGLISSGASLSAEVRDGLLRHRPDLILFDTLGSTESPGFALSTAEAGVFMPLPNTRVFDDDLREVVPGSDTIGMVYWGGPQPVGYYKEPEKTAETFVEIDGRRYVKIGDRCTVRADGNLVLLGRDSTVINTGGEKVYTVEVERVLVDHPAISDALVVGLPHPRFGKQVVAVVEGPGLTAENLDVEDIRAHAARHLADYKVPRQVFAIDSLQRAPNGKPDYPFVIGYAERCLGA